VASFALAMMHAPPPAKVAQTPVTQPPPAVATTAVSEKQLAWKDEGVQFIGGQIPARLLRRVTFEQRLAEDGTVRQVPREDVMVVPAVLR
jgi:hypothetical protein